jgi:hypothetical protein
MALGAYKAIEYLHKIKITPTRIVIPIFVLIVGIITYQHVNFYMVEYKNNTYFQDANGEFAMEVALLAHERGQDLQIFVLGAPRVFSGFPTFAFVAPDNPRIDLGVENIPILQLPTGGDIGFFAIPENRMALQEIIQRYPGGENGFVYRRPKPDEILFEYYILRR